MPLGPPQQYKAEYNSYTLPGYVQFESMDSTITIAQHPSPYADGSESENTGLSNKILTVRLKVWEPDYLSCTKAVQNAATMLRSKKSGFAPLYLQYEDRYYEALTQTIRREKTAGQPVRTLEYESTFECKPWLTSADLYTISGTGTINTDQVSRTIEDGGWTPTNIIVTGTNVTISGYTEAGDFAGFVSISGAVTNMVIDSENFTAEVSGVNKNNLMRYSDYRTYVGPEKTYFVTTGASEFQLSYRNRWYI